MRIFGLGKIRIGSDGQEIQEINRNQKKIMDFYRATFTTGTGKQTLDDLLWSLYFFSIAENEEQRIRQNVAREILNKLGIFNDEKSAEIVEQLLKIQTVLIEDRNAQGTT